MLNCVKKQVGCRETVFGLLYYICTLSESDVPLNKKKGFLLPWKEKNMYICKK